MKKIISCLVVLTMCISLAACGGTDKQAAIDAFNKASTSFNEVANAINANPDAYDQDVIDTMVEMADVLQQHKELLEGDTEIEEDKLNEMIEWYGTVEEWVSDVKVYNRFHRVTSLKRGRIRKMYPSFSGCNLWNFRIL